MSTATRIKSIELYLNTEITDSAEFSFERGVDGVEAIIEAPDQYVIKYEDAKFDFFPKSSLVYFKITTEEFELKSEGGIIIPETAAGPAVIDPNQPF